MRSGETRARYSPPAESLKLVWSSAPEVVRFLSEAKMMRCWPGARRVAGKIHLVRSRESSVRCQAVRSMGEAVGLWISIQSEACPSSSRSPVELEARNSVITGEPKSGTVRQRRARKRRAIAETLLREGEYKALQSGMGLRPLVDSVRCGGKA